MKHSNREKALKKLLLPRKRDEERGKKFEETGPLGGGERSCVILVKINSTKA